MGATEADAGLAPQVQALIGERLGPYCSFNAVNRAQIWQWCSAMGETSPLFLDEVYREGTEFSGAGAVAPPAMMQMWTMRDINEAYAPGSTERNPFPIMGQLEALGFTSNVAVSYDIRFHRYLQEGDRVEHFKTVVNVSDLKTTALGQGHFFTDRMEYLDQNGHCFAEALISYFQYRAASPSPAADGSFKPAEGSFKPAEGSAAAAAIEADLDAVAVAPGWVPDHRDLDLNQLTEDQALPALTIPITHKLIVGGAIASQDFVAVHHNPHAAHAASMPDIFMNILTSCGLCARYLCDWAGPSSRLQRLQLRLMNPNTPGDAMELQGKVSSIEQSAAGASARVEFAGMNSLGPHVMGSAELAFS